jgi:elongation factor 1 alpha-like protein
MPRNNNVDYDEDDLYSDDADYADEKPSYTAEDRENFASLTPVVRAELEEAGVTATAKQIEDALWYYYWDVGKSVAYLKEGNTPKQPKEQQETKKEKPKSKFDEAAQKSAEIPGKLAQPFFQPALGVQPERNVHEEYQIGAPTESRNVRICLDSLCPDERPQAGPRRLGWFDGTPWTNIPAQTRSEFTPVEPLRPMPKLLGGSSKLAKLAEERRKKAAAAQEKDEHKPSKSTSSLDRLGKSKDAKENKAPIATAEARRYPIRRRRSPTPPPKEDTPPPEQPKETLPDLRSAPTLFGQTLASATIQKNGATKIALSDLFGTGGSSNAFGELSPDDTVFKAQQRSKGLNK